MVRFSDLTVILQKMSEGGCEGRALLPVLVSIFFQAREALEDIIIWKDKQILQAACRNPSI